MTRRPRGVPLPAGYQEARARSMNVPQRGVPAAVALPLSLSMGGLQAVDALFGWSTEPEGFSRSLLPAVRAQEIRVAVGCFASLLWACARELRRS